MAHIFGSVWDRINRNALNVLSEEVEALGKAAQNLVAEGQLTEEQYAELLKELNRLIDEDDLEETKASVGAMVNALIQQFNLKPMDDPIYIENLWKPAKSVSGTLGASGNVSNHESNRTTPLIEILPNQNYRFERDSAGQIKVAFYDVEENHIYQTDWIRNETIKSPSNSRYMRVALAIGGTQNYMTTPFYISMGDYVPQGVKDGDAILYDGGFWENIPSPTLKDNSVLERHIKNGAVTKEKTDFIKLIKSDNIFDKYNIESGKSVDLNGDIIDLTTHWLSPLIKIENRNISMNTGAQSVRLAVYGANRNFSFLTGFVDNYTFTENIVSQGGYFRLSGTNATHPINEVMVNFGTELLPRDEYIYPYYEIDRDLIKIPNQTSTGDIADTRTPFPRKLKFEEVSNDWAEVNHLSRDGEIVYFKYGRYIHQSNDDGETLINIGSPSAEVPSIQAIRDLDDGELLVSTTRDEDINLKSKVYKTVGYDRENPENTQFKEVMEAISTQANIYGSWGLEAHDNICLASEYGLRGENGARHVYLSTDYGETWKMIFDQKTTTQNIDGAPTWTESAHLHTVHYDRYFDRIWLVVGDHPNSATYYSDDLGKSWKHVRNSDIVQYTGIVSFPDGVIFGSDRSPNGIYRWKRTKSKGDPVVIEPLELINDENVITHVFQRAFRRYAEKGEPAFFPATRISDYRGQYASVIMSMTGVGGAFNVYELPAEHSGLGFYNAVGITARGNILTSRHNGTNHSVLRAKAPLYE